MGLRPPNFDSKQLFLILCARHRVHSIINQEGGENAREGSVNRTI